MIITEYSGAYEYNLYHGCELSLGSAYSYYIDRCFIVKFIDTIKSHHRLICHKKYMYMQHVQRG